MPTHPLAEGCPCNRLGPVNSLQYHPTNKTGAGNQLRFPAPINVYETGLTRPCRSLLGSGLGGRLNRSFSGGGLLDRSLGSGGDLGGGLQLP